MVEMGWGKTVARLGLGAAALLGLNVLTGCVAVGYSTGGGWFVWPGGLGLVVLLLLLFFLLRGRR